MLQLQEETRAPERIINIGIFAHVDAGKTTLTEQLLLTCGRIRQAGSVDSGTAQTDFLSVERDRGISVMAATAELHWRGINPLDRAKWILYAGGAIQPDSLPGVRGKY